MKKKWYSILPWMTLSSGILVILFLALATVLKPSKTIESTINRKIALEKLNQIRVDSAANINSNAFFDYFEKNLSSSVIITKWLIAANGEIIYVKGMMAQITPLHSNAYDFEDNQSRGLISAVECNMDSIQKRVLLIAARIRGEGEHNDMIGHLVVPLKTSANVLVGFAGVAYDLDDVGEPFQNYYLIITAFIISFLLYWFSLPLWVYYDCREKNNHHYILWTLYVMIGNIPAFIAYLISDKK